MAEQANSEDGISSPAAGFIIYSNNTQEHGPVLPTDAFRTAMLQLHGPIFIAHYPSPMPIPAYQTGPMLYAQMRTEMWKQRPFNIKSAIRDHPDFQPPMGQDCVMDCLQAFSPKISRLLYAQRDVDKEIDEEAVGRIVSMGNAVLQLLSEVLPTLLALVCTDPVAYSVFIDTAEVGNNDEQNQADPFTSRVCQIPPLLGYCLDSLRQQTGSRYDESETPFEHVLAGNITLERHLTNILSDPEAGVRLVGYACPAPRTKKEPACQLGLCRFHCQCCHGDCYHKWR